jgi:hypothetical protein
MKNQILEILVDFTSEFSNNTSVFSGSMYTKSDVVGLLSSLVQRIHSVEEQPIESAPRINDEFINRLAEIAETFAVMHAQNCAENYEFDDIEFDTNEYRGELTVTADVNVDSHSFARSATFRSADVKTAIKDLLTPNTQANA